MGWIPLEKRACVNGIKDLVTVLQSFFYDGLHIFWYSIVRFHKILVEIGRLIIISDVLCVLRIYTISTGKAFLVMICKLTDDRNWTPGVFGDNFGPISRNKTGGMHIGHV